MKDDPYRPMTLDECTIDVEDDECPGCFNPVWDCECNDLGAGDA